MAENIEVTQPCQSQIDIANKYVWFLNEPNCDFNITDVDIFERVVELCKRAINVNTQQKKKGKAVALTSLHDPILSKFLNAFVFYVEKYTLQHLLRPRNKRNDRLNKTTLKHSPVVRIYKNSKIFIIAEFVPTNHNISLVRQWEFIQSCYFDYLCKELPQNNIDDEGYADYDSSVVSFVIKQMYSKLNSGESVDIRHMNSRLIDEERERFRNQLWLNNLNVTHTIGDNKVQTKVKGMCLTAIIGNHSDLLYDSKLSNYLQSSEPSHTIHVFYMVRSKLIKLIELINKKDSLNIGLSVLVLKLYINNDIFVLASNPSGVQRKNINALRENCYSVQHAFSGESYINYRLFEAKLNEIYD